MGLTYQEVVEILKILDQSTCAELHLQVGDLKLVARRKEPGAAGGEAVVPVAAAAAPPGARANGAATRVSAAALAPAAPANGAAARANGADAPAAAGEPAAVPAHLHAVKAPMVGTFYRAPAPDAPPFVEVGSRVEAGATLCLLDVMKLMTPVKAECSGRVAEICVQNGDLVEYGQVLFRIDPTA